MPIYCLHHSYRPSSHHESTSLTHLLSPHSYDYTKGKLDDLVGIIIDSGARLFVSAVGVPPKAVVDRLHKAGVLYMNMIGHPKHVQKCLDVGADMICAQGGEGGGHTGDVPTSILIPTVAQLVQGHKSPLTGDQVQVVAAGGIFNGQSLASALMLGASAVWVGTRFVLCEEAGAPKAHQEAVRTAGFDDNVRTIIFTGRPLRVRNNPYIKNWEENRLEEMKELANKGTIPVEHDFETLGDDIDDDTMDNARPFLMGKASAVVNERKSAKAIVDEMVDGAVEELQRGQKLVARLEIMSGGWGGGVKLFRRQEATVEEKRGYGEVFAKGRRRWMEDSI